MHPLMNNTINKGKINRQGNLYLAILWQNRLLFLLVFVLLISGSFIFVAFMIRPLPIILVDQEGRYIAQVNYIDGPPMDEVQLESMSKRFIQHYMSQNSATIYEDAEISLAAMCPQLRTKIRKEWVEGGKLARVVQRLQLSRTIFSDFQLLKYLNSDDIQVGLTGKILLSGTQGQDISSDFNLELSLKLVPINPRNYLGIEVCSVRLL